MEQVKNKTHLKPFDTALMDNLSMYDKVPYQSNYDFCNSSTIGLESGNLMKSYRVKVHEPYIVKARELIYNQNIHTEQFIEELSNLEEQSTEQDGLTPEQLESLLEDNELN